MGTQRLVEWKKIMTHHPPGGVYSNWWYKGAWRLAVCVPRQAIMLQQPWVVGFVCVIYKALVMLQRWDCWCSSSWA